MSGNQNVSEGVASAIAELKEGLLTDARHLEASGFRKLYNAGAEAVAPLLSELRRINLEQTENPRSTALLTGLATILHDISEDDSLVFIDSALAGQCHPVNQAVLRIIRRFSKSQFRRASVDGIDVFEAREIDQRYQATSHVSRWLVNVPDGDRSGISRIYIIDEDSESDFFGYYLPGTAVITIFWTTMLHPNIPIQWMFRFSHETTLYHEIGHHRCGHREGGQVPEQEAEADRYSRQLMRQSHPWLRRISKAVGWLFVSKKSRTRSDGDVR